MVYAPERLVDLKGARTVAGDYALGDLARRMNTELRPDDALAEYRKHLTGRTAIAFCTTIDHSPRGRALLPRLRESARSTSMVIRPRKERRELIGRSRPAKSRSSAIVR